MGRVVDLKTTRVWITPLPGFASYTAPKVTELNGVAYTDITCLLLPSSKIPSYDDDTTTSEMSICEGDEIVAITGSKYSGTFEIFQDFTGTGARSTSDPTKTLITGSSTPMLIVVRTGPAFDAAIAVGQELDLYPMTAGRFQKSRGSGSGFLKGKVKLYPLGGALENVALVA